MPSGPYFVSSPIVLNAVPSAVTIIRPLPDVYLPHAGVTFVEWTESIDPDASPSPIVKYSVQYSSDEIAYIDCPGLVFDVTAGVGLTADLIISFATTTLPDGPLWFRVRPWDGLHFGPETIVSTLGVEAEVYGDAKLIFLDPDTLEEWDRVSWRWWNPEYDPWAYLQDTIETFGSATPIRQPVKVVQRRAVLTGSGMGMDNDAAVNLLNKRTGIDTSKDWYRARVLFTDLYAMVWTVSIKALNIKFPRGFELANWDFEFEVEEVPEQIKTPYGGI